MGHITNLIIDGFVAVVSIQFLAWYGDHLGGVFDQIATALQRVH